MTLSFLGDDGIQHHIVIDSGYRGTYRRTLKKFAEEISKKEECIDLFIITHTDRDHIGGAQKLFDDFGKAGKIKKNLIKDCWFNWSHWKFPIADLSNSNDVSFKDGWELRDWLQKQEGMTLEDDITNETTLTLGGAIIDVLSPNKEKFYAFRNNWRSEERAFLGMPNDEEVAGGSKDWGISVKDLVNKPSKEDNAVENGSSIAFLFSLRDASILFLADAHPSVIVEALKKDYSTTNKLKVDYVKLAHHGSKYNTSTELLELLDCDSFLITTMGGVRPHKETLAKIAHYFQGVNPGRDIHFIFNYGKDEYQGLFSDSEKKDYRIKCYFAPKEPEIKANVLDIPTRNR